MNRSLLSILVFLIVFLANGPTQAEVRVVSWNVKFDPQKSPSNRSADFRALAQELKPDILILQEVVSATDVEFILDQMGFSNWSYAISDFTPDGKVDSGFAQLEVAIASRFEIAQAIEFDPLPETEFAAFPQGDLIVEQRSLAQDQRVKDQIIGSATERGFLWTRLKGIPLEATGLHLKSSRGTFYNFDQDNARQREFIAAHIAHWIGERRLQANHVTQLVAGDFNVAPRDPLKTGHDLNEDCTAQWRRITDDQDLADAIAECNGVDGYDDTLALLTNGLLTVSLQGGQPSQIRMKNLSESLGSSYVGGKQPQFPNSPIDNILADGPGATGASAQLVPNSYGSDHYPVLAILPINTGTESTPASEVVSKAVDWQRGPEFKKLVTQIWENGERSICRQILAANPKGETWAIVVDADETFLDNSEYQRRTDLVGISFRSSDWTKWTIEQAEHAGDLAKNSENPRMVYGIEPALAFLESVDAGKLCGRTFKKDDLDFRIAIITNRKIDPKEEAESTRNLLKILNVPYHCLELRNQDRDKTERRRRVRDGESDCGKVDRIAIYAGDNLGDLPSKNEPDGANREKHILLPNPMY